MLTTGQQQCASSEQMRRNEITHKSRPVGRRLPSVKRALAKTSVHYRARCSLICMRYSGRLTQLVCFKSSFSRVQLAFARHRSCVFLSVNIQKPTLTKRTRWETLVRSGRTLKAARVLMVVRTSASSVV